MTATGWTSREMDQTPWPAVVDLLHYWRENPPLHVMVRAYLGIGKGGQGITPTSEAELSAGIAGL